MNKEKSVRRWFVDQDPIRSDLVNFMFNVLVLNVTDQIFQSWPISVRLWFFDNNKNASKPGDATSLEFAWLA